jgi:6-phosphogluconolactonase
MTFTVLPDSAAVALAAAEHIAAAARAAAQARGRFTLAVSGGSTPWVMLRHLADEDVHWPAVHLFQVDERAAPAGSPDRNWTHLTESLLGRVALNPEQVHPMPVEADDLPSAAANYATELSTYAGSPPVLDLVHLGLGTDGHTASLVPGDPALAIDDRDVALAGPYQGHRRMTLTYPLLNRARQILWVVTGAPKRSMLPRLLAGDPAIPAGRIRRTGVLVLADRDAAGDLSSQP